MTDRPLVLIVEDNYFVLLDLMRTIEDAGFEVLEAQGFENASRVFQQHEGKIQILVTSIGTDRTGHSGLDLAFHVAKAWPSTSIVVSSGQEHLTEQDLPHGAVFLPKPFSDFDLLKRLKLIAPDAFKEPR